MIHLFVYGGDEPGGIHNFKGAFDTIELAEQTLITFTNGYAHTAVFQEEIRHWDIVSEYMHCNYVIRDGEWRAEATGNDPRWIGYIVDTQVGWYEVKHAS